MGRMIVRSFSLTEDIVAELDKIPRAQRSEWMRNLLREVLLEGKKPMEAPAITPELIKQMIDEQLAKMSLILYENRGETAEQGEFDVLEELDEILKLGE